MKRKIKNGIKIEKRCNVQGKCVNPFRTIVMLRSILFAAGLNFVSSSLFSTLEISPILLTAIEVPFCCLVCFLFSGKRSGIAILTSCAALLLYLAIALPQIKQGIGMLMNDCIDALIRMDGKIRLSVTVEKANPIWILMLFCGINVLLSSKLASSKCAALPICTTAAVLIYVLVGLAPSPCGAALLTVASLTGVMYAPSGVKPIATVSSRGNFLSAAAGIVSILLLFSAAVCLALPFAGLCENKLSSEFEHSVHHALFDSSSNIMPEGRLSSVTARKKSSAPALVVNFGQNETKRTAFSSYFRGMTGEVYTGHGWDTLPKEQLVKYNDLFYWLHKSGFYAQSQLGTAVNVIMQAEAATSEIMIENISACKRFLYLPYTALESELLDTSYIGDSSCLRNRRAGSICNVVCASEIPALQYIQHVAARQDNELTANYIAAERAYSAFVHENYLQLTPESTAVMARIFGAEPEELKLKEVLNLVSSALRESIVYDEEVKGSCGENDFATYVLEVSKRGYDVHYASCAVLMLRYFGVPSRYVEGYCLGKTVSPYGAVTLTEENAHAWAEYYIEGVGWIPFEATPGYESNIGDNQSEVDDLDDPDDPDNPDDLDNTYKNDKLPDISLARPPKKLNSGNRLKLSKAVFLLLLLSLLLILLLILVLRRVLLRRSISRMLRADNNESIAMMFGYATMLRKAVGMTDLIECEVISLNDEAAFSNHRMSDEQKAAMQDYLEKTLAECIRSRSFFKRIYDRFIACLYI